MSAELSYTIDEVYELYRPPLKGLEQDGRGVILLNVAAEITNYLYGAVSRPSPTPNLTLMTLAVSDIWRLVPPQGGNEAEGQLIAAGAVLAATAVLPDEDDPDAGDQDLKALILKEAHQKVAGMLGTNERFQPWWQAAQEIGRAANFSLATDAARARRLWDALLWFVALDTEVLDIDPGRLGTAELRNIRSKVSETQLAGGKQIGEELTAATTSPPIPTVDTFELVTEVQGVGPTDGDSFMRRQVSDEDFAPLEDDMEDLEVALAEEKVVPPKGVRVWFGTNRTFRTTASNDIVFGTTMAESVTYGHCWVDVPEVPDASKEGWRRFLKWLTKSTGKKRGSKRGQTTIFKAPDEFVRALRDDVSAGATSCLIYVHGYNNSFDDAAIDIAEMAVAVKHRGPTAMFSWASKNRTLKYLADRKTVARSVQHFLAFLRTVHQGAGELPLDVMIHSLGNELFLRALEASIDTNEGFPFLRNLYFGAPDLAQQDLLKNAERVRACARKRTLYLASFDTPLRASQILSGEPRAGELPAVLDAESFDTIDASYADSSPFGHGYIMNSLGLRSDIWAVQFGKDNPDDRPNIELVNRDVVSAAGRQKGTYWAFGRGQ